MSESLQDKWNERYKNQPQAGSAAQVLTDNRHLLPKQGRALDLACGLGANALLLAETNLDVHAWDIAGQALQYLAQAATKRGLSIDTLQRDIEQQPPDAGSFDVIIVSHFLYRPICPALINALKPGGLLFYQTWCQEKISEQGPTRDAFLLSPGELLLLFKELELIAYREERNCGNIHAGLRNQAYFVGRFVPG